MPFFFEKKVSALVARKLHDKQKYDENIRNAFDCSYFDSEPPKGCPGGDLRLPKYY